MDENDFYNFINNICDFLSKNTDDKEALFSIKALEQNYELEKSLSLLRQALSLSEDEEFCEKVYYFLKQINILIRDFVDEYVDGGKNKK